MKKLTKCLSLVLSLALLLTLLPSLALTAHAEVYSGYCGNESYYGDDGEWHNGENLTWTLDTNTGALTIEGSGAMSEFGWYENVPWYPYRESIHSVSLPAGLTSIGESAFNGCTGLTSVDIPEGVTSIGGSAFSGCSGLTSIAIPDGVTSIKYSTFYDCTGLTSVDLPDGVTSIGEGAFSGCTGLTSVDIPDGVTSIGGSTFYGCTGLTSVDLPDGLTSIGWSAFFDCTGLTSVDLPEGVTSIGGSAFRGCTGLTSMDLPDGVTSIGGYAFSGCTGLYRVNITNLDAWCRIDFQGDEANPTTYAHRLFLNGKQLKEAVLPEDLTKVNDYVFVNCSGLTSVTIPAGVTSIGDYAFSGCTSLTSMDLPDGVTSIGDGAFDGCTGLTAMDLPENVTAIGSNAFRDCANLADVHLPEGLKMIGEYAFYSCEKLENLSFPQSLTGIGASAFEFCNALTTVTIPSGITSISNYTFWHCRNLESIIIREGAASIGEYAFRGTSPHHICLPSSLQVIRKGALSNIENDFHAHVLYAGSESEWEDVLVDDENELVTQALYFHYSAASWEEHVSIKSGAPATCTKGGTVTYTCPCGYEWTEEQAALGHNFVDGKCTRCGHWDPSLNEFGDVAEGKYYFDAVLWAVHHDPQITGGTGDGQFSPNKTCTREQIVTFLWKAKGAPSPVNTESPFTDVKSGKYYFKAVMWAVENKITGGTSADKFGVGKPCTREQAMSFLWKACGSPEPTTTENPFTDVIPGKYYYKAVLWAVENKITGGTSADKFGVGKPCTRGQIVTFLYKAIGDTE